MNWQAVVFLVLVCNQLVSTATFLGLYVRESDWRRTPIGRHVLYWSAAAGALDLSWLLLLVARWPWLVYVLLAAQAAIGLVTWQRVWLVWRATRPGRPV